MGHQAIIYIMFVLFQIKLLETEVSKRDSMLEKQRREYDDKILVIESNKQEAIETSVELRLAVHAREMNKVQTAINTQLEQVIARQKYLGNFITIQSKIPLIIKFQRR